MNDKNIFFVGSDGDEPEYTFIPDEGGDDDEMEMVDIEFDDGTSGTYQIIVKFEVEGRGSTYAALAPAEEDDSDELEILIYRYFEDNGDVSLETIDDDEELDEITAVLDEIFNEITDNEDFNSEDE